MGEREWDLFALIHPPPPLLFFSICTGKILLFSLLVRFPFSLWFVYGGIGKLLLGIFYFFALLYFENNYRRTELLTPERVIILKYNISPKGGGHVLSNRKRSPIKSLLLKGYKWSFVKLTGGRVRDLWRKILLTVSAVFLPFLAIFTHLFNSDLIFWLYRINPTFLWNATDLVSLRKGESFYSHLPLA